MSGDENNKLSKLSRLLTIRNSLFALVGVLVLATVAFNVNGALDAMNNRHLANQVVAHNSVSDKLLESAKYWSAERAIVATALGDAQAVSDERLKKIMEARKAGDAAYQAALDQMKSLDSFSHEQELMDSGSNSFAEIEALRTHIDTALHQAEEDREGRIDRTWFRSMTDLIEKTQQA